MTETPRTFKLPDKGEKTMTGSDVKAFQQDIKSVFKSIGIDCPIVIDGKYQQATRGYAASLCEALGLSWKIAMKDGVTPELRTKLRHKQLSAAERKNFDSKKRKDYRAGLRDRWRIRKVHTPLTLITTSAWGYHPGVHDGVDVTGQRPGLPVFAMVKAKVIDVRMSDWWGNNPSGNVALGDGIVQIEVLESVGPFKKGMHLGYGHVEQPNNKPLVKVGQIVEAGDQIAALGLAVTPHIHLMANHGETGMGVGKFDPRPLLNYAVKNG